MIAVHEEARAHGFQLLHPDDVDPASMLDLGFKPEVVAVMQLLVEDRAGEIFLDPAGPGYHDSWLSADLAAWLQPAVERFHETVGADAQMVMLEAPDDPEQLDDQCFALIAELLASGQLRRDRAVQWTVVQAPGRDELLIQDDNGEPTRVGSLVDAAWDGLRSLPFDDAELAAALGRSIAAVSWPALSAEPAADLLAELFAAECEWIELISESRGEARAFVAESSLRATLRPDLAQILKPEWRHLAEELHLLLLVIGNPVNLFRFDYWLRLFASQIIPAQVYLSARGKAEWVIYNFTQVAQIRRL